MNWISLITGFVLIVCSLLDLVWTSLWVSGGAGPMTRRISWAAWVSIKFADRGTHRVLVFAGPAILVLTVVGWMLILWAGWALVFVSERTALMSSSTDSIASFAERLYFTGYTLFTMGNGDFRPVGVAWQIATVLAAGTGLFAMTLSVTYLLSVVSAAVAGRALASSVNALGRSPAEVMAAAWDGTRYSQLAWPLQNLTAELSKFSEQLLAYPVLQFFHGPDQSKSPIVQIARLEQVLAVAQHGIPAAACPPQLLLNLAHSAIGNVLEYLAGGFVRAVAEPLPAPDLQPLQDRHLPALGARQFRHALKLDECRRKKVRGLLETHGWNVDDL